MKVGDHASHYFHPIPQFPHAQGVYKSFAQSVIQKQLIQHKHDVTAQKNSSNNDCYYRKENNLLPYDSENKLGLISVPPVCTLLL